MSSILGGDSTLNGETASVDVLLRETELLKRDARCDLDLGGNNVDTGDLLCDSGELRSDVSR